MKRWLATFVSLLWSISASASGTISGVVTAQDTAKPLRGVTVTIYENCGGDGCFSGENLITGADGRYSTHTVPSGLTYVAAHYLPGEANYAPADGQFYVVDDGASLTIDFALAKGATVEGVIRSKATGALLSNIPVVLEAHQPDGGQALYYNYGTALSDTQGRYSFRQLPATSYEIVTTNRGSTPYRDQYYAGHDLTSPSQGSQAIDIIALSAGQDMNHADFSLNVGGRIEGTLTDRYDGTPIANAQEIIFSMYDVTPLPYCCEGSFDDREATTNAQGHFAIQGLTDAPFYLSAASIVPWYSISYIGCVDPCANMDNATRFQIATAGTKELDIALFPGAVVTGTVTRHSDGQPLAGVVVSGYESMGAGSKSIYATATTDALGHYTLRGEIVNAGLGVFDAQADGVSYIDQVFDHHDCQFGSCFLIGDDPQLPEYYATPNIDFSLDAGASISGQILTGDTLSGIHSYVFLYAPDRSFSAETETSADGKFRTSGLQPGTYYLAGEPSDLTLYGCTFYGSIPCDSDFSYPAVPGAQPILVGANDRGGIVLELEKIDGVFNNGFE